MANNTEVIFEEIEQRIIKEIEGAHYAIFVSVAWFTNKKLFNALLEKAKSNCYVSIIIQLDEINSQSGIDYSQIEIGRSECFKISKDAELLHDKFCVIDFKKVITGSYNWTYKAAHNSENILILDDPTVATQYISRFEQQKSKYAPSSAKQGTTVPSETKTIVDTPKVVKAPPTTKQCPSCKEEIGYNDGFCQHCGKQLKENVSKRVLICKKCSHKQNDSLLDVNTHYCTNCGAPLIKVVDWDTKKQCPICKNYSFQEMYCSSCGVPWKIVPRIRGIVKIGGGYVDNPYKLMNLRPEFATIEDYQCCSKCETPNPFGAKFCRSCGKNMTLQAKDKKGNGWVDLGLSVLWSTETMITGSYWMRQSGWILEPTYEEYEKMGEMDPATGLGPKWRMPTKREFEELIEKCKWEKVVLPYLYHLGIGPCRNVNAFKVTGPNGNHIFLPTRWSCPDNEYYAKNVICTFWTSTKSEKHEKRAYAFRYGIEGTYKSEQDKNSLWLSEPLNLDDVFRVAANKKAHLEVRPVADKKWQGKL